MEQRTIEFSWNTKNDNSRENPTTKICVTSIKVKSRNAGKSTTSRKAITAANKSGQVIRSS